VQVLTYALMSNHFHILVEVDPRDDIPEGEVAHRIRALYSPAEAEGIIARWAHWRGSGMGHLADEDIDSYRRRMGDVSEFIKTLKQRYTQSYNRRNKRRGHLWEDRFKSVLIEAPPSHAARREGPGALMTVASYIDLNAVRAGIAELPEDYRWCGYGEAVAGGRRAREGLLALHGVAGGWRQVSRRYRFGLAAAGEERVVGSGADERLRAGIDPEVAQRIMESGGELSLADALRCRVRYFSDSLVLGSAQFVEGVMARHRGAHSSTRRRAVPLRHADFGELCTDRHFRGGVIFIPTV
jgi:putative transposase